MSDLEERLTKAFADLFAGNRPYFGGGGPGYYGVRLENIAPDAAELDVVLTFRSGVRYCCCEPGCHFAFYSERGWAWLRDCLDRAGLSALPLPTIRRFRGVIERGAILDTAPAPKARPCKSKAFDYEAGPYAPPA